MSVYYIEQLFSKFMIRYSIVFLQKVIEFQRETVLKKLIFFRKSKKLTNCKICQLSNIHNSIFIKKKMGQKINPVSLRLQYTNRHFDSCWYSEYFYKNLITRDVFLQHYLNTFLKLLKLPAGRYSIQHLQKKTQIYNFLCIPKSTREWRAKLFGFAKNKNVLKKNRYFFKKKTDFKKKMKKQTKLNCFYTTLNQLAVHQIQKKITSFQNFRLWSALIKPKQKAIINNSTDMVLVKSSLVSSLDNWKKHELNGVFAFPKKALLTIAMKNISANGLVKLVPKNRFFGQPELLQKSPHSFQKNDFLDAALVPFSLEKEQNVFLETKKTKNLKSSPLGFNKQADDSNLLFLQNLFVYKTLKAKLITKSGPQFGIEEATKRRSFLNQKEVQKKDFLELDPKRHLVNSLTPASLLSLSSFQTLESKYEKYLESSLSSLYQLDLDLIPFKVKNDWQYAGFLADEIVSLLEKRIPFRRLKSKLIKQLSKVSAIRGVRITCSGRVGGKSKKAQRAKIESLKYGQTSLHVFSAPIDFSCKTARTSFGSVGVKVWICYQENLDTHSF